ncbi:MAG TPA: hypothetical protein VJ184_01835 [Chryseolinea sp.]|nr:hypothetical protein [Chryseolinea sp.]
MNSLRLIIFVLVNSSRYSPFARSENMLVRWFGLDRYHRNGGFKSVGKSIPSGKAEKNPSRIGFLILHTWIGCKLDRPGTECIMSLSIYRIESGKTLNEALKLKDWNPGESRDRTISND